MQVMQQYEYCEWRTECTETCKACCGDQPYPFLDDLATARCLLVAKIRLRLAVRSVRIDFCQMQGENEWISWSMSWHLPTGCVLSGLLR